ncbi:plasmodesmata-located protein 8 isoform X2 [Lotus japonicus]|uniref:plasmodesmata-located protein 8 isoform X2 n=1 Tax=Lotus japonicus TaxID=34305 RepID=UPI002586E907|nr:plasmodesmata-located protein 8 isoform X2 [Lotus japonicus]
MLSSLQLDSTDRIILSLRLTSLLIIFLSSSPLHAHGNPSRTHIFIYAGCSQEKYQPSSPFEANLNTFLSSVVSSSSEITYNTFAVGNGTGSTPPEGTVYGLYQCRGDLHPIDCSKCVGRSVNQINLVCPYALGASLQLEGCLLRYEHSGDFLGKLDTGIKFRKCSKSVTSDVEFFRRRDDVLADLQTASGFRVSSSGLVQGYAQCLGDLTVSDCSSCLVDAVGKLKSLCGSAAAADVFLGQCYARYWASGYYDELDSSNNDDVGKSVAIIVGVFGGLAILVVLLSICKKAAGK